MLIDSIMPLYQFNEVQTIIVRSNTRSIILNAVRDVTPEEIPDQHDGEVEEVGRQPHHVDRRDRQQQKCRGKHQRR